MSYVVNFKIISENVSYQIIHYHFSCVMTNNSHQDPILKSKSRKKLHKINMNRTNTSPLLKGRDPDSVLVRKCSSVFPLLPIRTT